MKKPVKKPVKKTPSKKMPPPWKKPRKTAAQKRADEAKALAEKAKAESEAENRLLESLSSFNKALDEAAPNTECRAGAFSPGVQFDVPSTTPSNAAAYAFFDARLGTPYEPANQCGAGERSEPPKFDTAKFLATRRQQDYESVETIRASLGLPASEFEGLYPTTVEDASARKGLERIKNLVPLFEGPLAVFSKWTARFTTDNSTYEVTGPKIIERSVQPDAASIQLNFGSYKATKQCFMRKLVILDGDGRIISARIVDQRFATGWTCNLTYTLTL